MGKNIQKEKKEKGSYWCYRATVTFSGCLKANTEAEAIQKVIADSEKLPEVVSFKKSEVKVRRLQKKPNHGLYGDNKYEW